MENDLNIHFVVCPNKEIKLKYNTYGYAYYRYGIFIYCFFFFILWPRLVLSACKYRYTLL